MKFPLLVSSKVLLDHKFATVKEDKLHWEHEDGDSVDYKHITIEGIPYVVVAIMSNNSILMTRQYRYSVGEDVYEFVAGYVDKGETPLDAAIREAKEEAGVIVKSDNMMYLGKIYPQTGKSNVFGSVYFCDQFVQGDKDLDKMEKEDPCKQDN